MFLVHTDEGLTGISKLETQPYVAAAIVGAPGGASGFFSGLRALAVGRDPLQSELSRSKTPFSPTLTFPYRLHC